MKKIYVIHSGCQHVNQSALAFQENMMLEKFISSFLIKDYGIDWYKFFKNKNIQKIISLKETKGIDPRYIINHPYYEFVEVIIKIIIGNNSYTADKLSSWRDIGFAKNIIKYIDIDCLGVFGFPNNMLEVFKKVGKNPIKIIEQPIGYSRAAIEIFEEEKYINPDFADSITYANKSDIYLERIDEELNLTNVICVPSEFVKLSLVKYGYPSEKIKMNPYGSYLKAIAKKDVAVNLKRNLTVLFVGQISQRKGIKYLLDAVKNIKNKDKNSIKFILVGKIFGDGNWMRNYKEYIDEYYPVVPRNEMKSIYEKSDIFVLPSLFEGSALVVYEALAHGMACIVTPNTGADMIIDQ
ncbi:glycosyltransferase family 4 protein, partial [bacterium]|nr:glycosyltransferase family 4 protein [bacterium]